MDDENHGKSYEQIDDFGEKKTDFWKHPYIYTSGQIIIFHQPRFP